MTFVSILDGLSKPELLWLLKRHGNVDNRDIANCRWELAEAKASALRAIAHDLEDAQLDALIAVERYPENKSIRLKQLSASMAAIKARSAADRATRAAATRLKELQKHYLPRAIK